MTKFYYVYLLIDVATETHRYTGVTEDLQARLAIRRFFSDWSDRSDAG